MIADITQRNEQTDRDNFDYTSRVIDVYLHGNMTREDIESENNSDYIQFIHPKGGNGSYVLRDDIEDYTLNNANKLMTIQSQSLDDINWEED